MRYRFMMLHDDNVRLQHMLEYAEKAVFMLQGRGPADLRQDEMLCLALTRAVEVVGEAAARVSQPTRDSNPDIPWSQVIGLRNRLVHGYASVDLTILYTIVEQDLPHVVQSLKNILQRR